MKSPVHFQHLYTSTNYTMYFIQVHILQFISQVYSASYTSLIIHALMSLFIQVHIIIKNINVKRSNPGDLYPLALLHRIQMYLINTYIYIKICQAFYFQYLPHELPDISIPERVVNLLLFIYIHIQWSTHRQIESNSFSRGNINQ